MRTIQVLGVTLQDYSIREAMKKVDIFLRDGRASTVAYITTRGLLAAENSEELKTFLKSMDLTVAADSDILRAAGAANRNRVREIDNDEFMTELLKKLVRGRKTVYLLTSTQEQLKTLEEGIRSYQESIRIVGRYSLDTLEQDEEYLVNEINVQMPNVVISNIASPQREEFFEANHMKLNTDIWLMLKDEVVHANKRKNPIIRLRDKLVRSLFHHKVVQYQNQKADEESMEEEKKTL